jgi:hypothetical protein
MGNWLGPDVCDVVKNGDNEGLIRLAKEGKLNVSCVNEFDEVDFLLISFSVHQPHTTKQPVWKSLSKRGVSIQVK